jgi:hypothetical protein
MTITAAPQLRRKKREFLSLLNDADATEPDVQNYLENNTELISLPWRLNHALHQEAIISKFPLDPSIITDFAYLTKSSGEWYLVLVELEDPKKPIFKSDKKRVMLSRDLTAALDQMAEWKVFAERHKDEIVGRISLLRRPLEHNRVRIKYVLIYGRRKELTSQERIDRLASLGDGSQRIVTYDSLLSKAAPDEWWPKNVLTLTKRMLRFKYLHQLDVGLFTYNSPSEIVLTPTQRGTLIAEGYDIPSWERGKYLTLNHKYVSNDEGWRRMESEIGKDSPARPHPGGSARRVLH